MRAYHSRVAFLFFFFEDRDGLFESLSEEGHRERQVDILVRVWVGEVAFVFHRTERGRCGAGGGVRCLRLRRARFPKVRGVKGEGRRTLGS